MARLIDAEEMKTGICFIITDSKELLTSSVARKAMLGLVDRCKTVDAAPVVHGRWKKRKSWACYVCSECSFEEDGATKYCPNCGALMQEDK